MSAISNVINLNLNLNVGHSAKAKTRQNNDFSPKLAKIKIVVIKQFKSLQLSAYYHSMNNLLFNCNQFILRNKDAYSHNKIVLCQDYYTSTLSIYH